MRLLLDTHSFLWFIAGNPRLSDTARSLIEAPANSVLLSVGSLWEMAIKVSLGKLTLGQPFPTLIPQQLDLNGIELLGITTDHAAAVAMLPFPPDHRDPFDRLIVAQARVEQLPLVSRDEVLDAYGIMRLW